MFISPLHILYLKPSADPIFVADKAFYYEGDPIPIYYSIAKRLGTALVAQDVISQYTSVPLSDGDLERGIGTRRWDTLPGMSWKHERPLEEVLDDDSAPTQVNSPEDDSRGADRVISIFECLGCSDSSQYINIYPNMPNPLPDVESNIVSALVSGTTACYQMIAVCTCCAQEEPIDNFIMACITSTNQGVPVCGNCIYQGVASTCELTGSYYGAVFSEPSVY
ncbi:hypothetical protein MFIFM68171_01541 [Madurella fahalii]|uniref:Uncharacterized protein n=1 Tax=Madurella fahalii TaxID=1157608 RepID=A0ABQ0G0Q1_9PEZI